MNLNKVMKKYRQESKTIVEEERILDTVNKSKAVFYQKEQEKMLTYWEFLMTQLKITQKRWWLFQILLLAAAEALFLNTMEEYYIRRGLGIIGVLFIVFVIPELWKNRTYCCMEIEAASYYSLTQIYAARIFMFGLADVFILTLFCGSLQKYLYFTLAELMIQFLLPMAVTACICFWTLCSSFFSNELTPVALCLLWSAIWWMITAADEIYTIVVLPVWGVLFGGAVLCLFLLIYKNLRYCSKYWEINNF